MANVTDLKRLVIEDFSKDDQALVQKIAFSYNPMTEQLVAAFAKGIDFNNLNQQFEVFTITVDNTGTPTVAITLKYDLKTRLKGCQVIAALNLDDSTPLTGAPFISYTMTNNQLSLNHITGLPANKKYQLSAILYG